MLARAQTFPISALGNSTSKTSTSNYSFFGLGEELYNGPCESIGRGGLGVGYVSYLSPNFNNPASLYQNKLATFQVGVKLSELNQSTSTTNSWSNNGALNYATLAFPINKWWGSGFSLNPAYAKGYDINTSSTSNVFGNVNYFYRGSSSINRVNWSNGINPFKWFSDSLAPDFSIGFGASYYFGTGTAYNRAEFANNSLLGIYNIVGISEDVYGGFQYNLGFMHRVKIDTLRSFSFGGTYDFGNKIFTDNNYQSYTFIVNTPVIDTVDYNKSRIDIKLPSAIKFGATFTYKEKLNIGFEYRRNQYSKFQFGSQKNNMRDVNTYILGAELNPMKTNGGRLLNTNYRIGFRYAEKPYLVNGNKINEYAVNIGIGIPVKRAFTTANIGLEYIKRGTTSNNLILEKYFNAFIGLTINDKWFNKPKYD